MARPRDWPYLAVIVAVVIAVALFAWSVTTSGEGEPDTWTPATISPPDIYEEP